MPSAATVFTRGALALTGLLHLVRPGIYEPLVPDELPAKRALVYASGVTELATALATLHPRTLRLARWIGVGTMLGVFPTHVHMIARRDRWPKLPVWALWGRLPLQAVFCRWIWQATRA